MVQGEENMRTKKNGWHLAYIEVNHVSNFYGRELTNVDYRLILRANDHPLNRIVAESYNTIT